jgi:hypothetical protein
MGSAEPRRPQAASRRVAIGYSGRPERPPMKPFPRTRNASSWLRNEPVFAALGEHAARLTALQADLEQAMPELGLLVVALERDTLVVGAAHAAVAAKVRQIGPTVLAGLARRGWKIEKIRFKPQWRPVAVVAPRRAKEAPSAQAIAAIDALSDRIEDPRLRAALRRLASRHPPPEAA